MKFTDQEITIGQALKLGSIATLIFILVVGFMLWLFHIHRYDLNNPISNEAYNQSKIEAVKWKFKYDSVSVEYARIMAGIERKINNSNKKIKQNEITKKQDAALSDSLAYKLRDSLRAEYRKRYVNEVRYDDTFSGPRFSK